MKTILDDHIIFSYLIPKMKKKIQRNEIELKKLKLFKGIGEFKIFFLNIILKDE